MPVSSAARLTVVYPIIQCRGQAATHARTWTHGQTLARDRYRVVAASNGADPAQEREVQALLGPGDDLVRAPGARDVSALWNAGAARAGTPWLVLSEGHCRADPSCLEAVARWIASRPAEGAGNFAVGHDHGTLVARLSRRWFAETQARWRTPGEWPRLHRAGFAISAAALEAVGGFESQYGEFAPPLLSARLHARGIGVTLVRGAAVVHVDAARMRAHHADTTGYARGEMDARSRNEPVFFERYFGHASIWANRLRYRPPVARAMARAVVAAALAHPERRRELARILRPLAGAAVLGLGPRATLQRLAVALEELAIERLPMPPRWRWGCFMRAHDRVVHQAQLQWARDQAGPPPPSVTGPWPIEALGPDTIVGVHGLEVRGRRAFRWTEPAVLLRVAPPTAPGPTDGEHEVAIETGNLRGNPLDAVIAVVAGGRVLPRRSVTADEEGTLRVTLPARWTAAARTGLVIVCDPLLPARLGAPDSRRLGLPVFSVAVAPAPAGARAAMAAV